MSDNFIEFSNIHQIKDNNKNEYLRQDRINQNINNNYFQAQLNKLKNNFNKLQNSITDIIEKKEFNFKDFLENNLNIQCLNQKNKNNTINLSYSSLKNENNFDNDENMNESETNNIIMTNNEKDSNSYFNSDKNINNYIITSLKDNSLSHTDNINSINSDNNLSINNKSSSSLNNLFIVKTENKKNKKLLSHKRSNINKNINKKENLSNQILRLYNQIIDIVYKFVNYFKIVDNKNIRTIIIEGKKISDIYLYKDKIKKIYSYENNLLVTKEKEIIEQLNIILKTVENKMITLGLNIKNDN
jgi:hypothetical protein